MGTSLTGLTPAATYQGLIKFGDNSAISATLRYLSDGLGNDLPISVASASVGINTTTGSALFNIKGTGASLSTSPLTITNSAGTNVIQALDNTNIYFGKAIKIGSGGTITDTSGFMTMYNGGNTARIGPEYFSTDSSGWSATILNGGPTLSLSYLGYGAIDRNWLVGTSPSNTARLSVKGSGSTSATSSVLVQNSGGTQLFKAFDDGVIEAGGATANQFKVMNTEGLAISRDGSLDANIRIREFSGSGPVFKMNGNSTPTFKMVDSSNFNCIVTHANWTGIAKGTVENTSAALQTDSTSRGWLPPRMTDAQVRAIATPANGLVVYNSTIDYLCVYQAGAWVKINHSPM
jgi:hypothetical protein